MPIEHVDKSKLPVSEKEMYEKKGIEAIKYNKFAVVTMAGGQGTRLGHTGPKGTYIFDPEKGKSIFEALCETLKKAWRKYDTVIPWYIMTSKENNDATQRFFERNNYFGYPENHIRFFMQGELPMLSTDGKILLSKDGLVKMAANGHGGTLHSMETAGVLDEMKHNGIEWVFINGVDNVLVKPVDPLLIGMSIHNKVLGAVKSIEKTDPKEKVGVFCRKNKKVGVVEYTEISDKMANLRDDYGSLVYGDANAIFHLYNIKGLEKVSDINLPDEVVNNLIVVNAKEDIFIIACSISRLYKIIQMNYNILKNFGNDKEDKEEIMSFIFEYRENKYLICFEDKVCFFSDLFDSEIVRVKRETHMIPSVISVIKISEEYIALKSCSFNDKNLNKIIINSSFM